MKKVKKALRSRQQELMDELEKKEKKIGKLESKVEELKTPQRGIESMFRLTANNQQRQD